MSELPPPASEGKGKPLIPAAFHGVGKVTHGILSFIWNRKLTISLILGATVIGHREGSFHTKNAAAGKTWLQDIPGYVADEWRNISNVTVSMDERKKKKEEEEAKKKEIALKKFQRTN